MNYFSRLGFILFISLLIFSCKKGPDDPVLSFRTRLNRVTGNWTIKMLDKKRTETSSGSTTTLSTSVIGNTGQIKQTQTGNPDAVENITDVTYEYTFSKDGTYSRKVKFSYLDVNGKLNTETFDGDGLWYFIDSGKRRSGIHLTDIYDEGDYYLEELRSKEMVLKKNAKHTETFNGFDDVTGLPKSSSLEIEETASLTLVEK